MNVKKRKLGKGAQFGLVFAGLLVYAALGYLLLIGPKRAEASDLTTQIAEKTQVLAANQAAAAAADQRKQIKAADLFHLTKAMPDGEDMSGVLLELNRVAEQSGIEFESIRPGAPVQLTGYRVVPVEVNFRGNFYALADFIYRLRNLVSVADGELAATGRLFAIDTMTFSIDDDGFRKISAKLFVDAYIYGTGPSGTAPAATTPAATTTTTSTDATATTSSTTTTPAPDAPPAAPTEDGSTAAGTAP